MLEIYFYDPGSSFLSEGHWGAFLHNRGSPKHGVFRIRCVAFIPNIQIPEMESSFLSLPVKELKTYLQDRGIVVGDKRRSELISLCEAANTLDLEKDPDGLKEDGQSAIGEKLKTTSGLVLQNPSLIKESTENLSILPPISIFDIYQYLLQFSDHETLRNYDKLEGFTMYKDGHVLDVQTVTFPNTSDYFAIKSHVKPRTREKDPCSSLPYYNLWIILSTVSTQGSIVSAYCTCKGGIDGGCRHIAATLFEVMEFRNDSNQVSVTSQSCMWVRRGPKKTTNIVLVTDLQTDIQHTHSSAHEIPKPCNHTPLAPDVELPEIDGFFKLLKTHRQSACMSDVKFERVKEKTLVPDLTVLPPMKKIELFFKNHDHDLSTDCCDQCNDNLLSKLHYSPQELEEIELSTQGQAENENWHIMRRGILTASAFSSICHSRDDFEKALTLIRGSTISTDLPPAAVQFGRNKENKARMLFIKSHRYQHRKCSIQVPGLIISTSHPYLGCSPDGIVKCSICKTFLIEIKCLHKYRRFTPHVAAVMAKICDTDEQRNLVLKQNHPFFYQIQGQMAITGIKRSLLVLYTLKGIICVEVLFEGAEWQKIQKRLQLFYNDYFYEIMKTNARNFDL